MATEESSSMTIPGIFANDEGMFGNYPGDIGDIAGIDQSSDPFQMLMRRSESEPSGMRIIEEEEIEEEESGEGEEDIEEEESTEVEDKQINDAAEKCEQRLTELRDKYSSEDNLNREEMMKSEDEITKLGGKLNDLMEDKINLESEIEESKNKNENCKSDLAISKTKSERLMSDIEELTMDLHVSLGLLSIVCIVLIFCIYKLNTE